VNQYPLPTPLNQALHSRIKDGYADAEVHTESSRQCPIGESIAVILIDEKTSAKSNHFGTRAGDHYQLKDLQRKRVGQERLLVFRSMR